MKLYCQCGILVAEIAKGSHIRKNSQMICQNCFERYKIADQMAKMARDQTKCDMPDFFKNIFGDKKNNEN